MRKKRQNGSIANDFHDRKDLTPNICAVYTEEAYRGRGILQGDGEAEQRRMYIHR